MKQAKRRFHSINFILWMSFLSFAAFIILITWVFQSTLLQVFFNAQTQRDLATVGEGMYEDLHRMKPLVEGNDYIDKYIRKEQSENPAAQIFLLNGNGEVLYPMYTQEEEEYELSTPPTFDMFAAVRGELEEKPESVGVTVQKSDGDFVFLAKVGSIVSASGSVLSESNDAYLYIDYSTEIASMAMGTMRVQLIMISVIVIFLALVLSALLSMKLTKPITQITKAAQRMATGDFSVNFKGHAISKFAC